MSASACPGGAPSQESGPVQHAASAITAPDTDQLPAYWQFHEAVTRAQLGEWLPTGRHLLVDVSGPRAPGAELAAKAGHTVVRVLDGARQGRPPESVGPGRIIQVIADSSRLTFLSDGCADGIIADDRALSVHLAAEAMIAEIARVLRPAGRQDHQVLRPGPGARAVHRGRAPGQLDPVADRVVRVGGDALAAARPRRVAQAGARRTRGPVRRVARGAAGDLGQQAPPQGV